MAATTCRKSGSFAGDSRKYTEFQVSGKCRRRFFVDMALSAFEAVLLASRAPRFMKPQVIAGQ